jgi:hypothetical protein
VKQAEHDAQVKRQAKRDAEAKQQEERERQAKQQAERDAEAKQQEERERQLKLKQQEERERKRQVKHDKLMKQAQNDAWYAMDWEDEAWQELKEAEKNRDRAKANNFGTLTFWEPHFKKAQREYEEALATHQHIMWLLEPECLYQEFRELTDEEYAAYRDGRDIKRGRAALRNHYPCTPSRHPDTEDRQ